MYLPYAMFLEVEGKFSFFPPKETPCGEWLNASAGWFGGGSIEIPLGGSSPVAYWNNRGQVCGLVEILPNKQPIIVCKRSIYIGSPPVADKQ